MFKNTKFLYCIIAVLLTVCILCGIHIAKDFSIMYKSREHLLASFAVDVSELVSWSGEIIDPETDSDTLNTAVIQVKNNLDEMCEHLDFLYGPYSTYNIVFTEQRYQEYPPEIYISRYRVDAELLAKRYSETGTLSEEDMLWIKTLNSAANTLLDELVDENIEDEYIINVKKEYIRKDDLVYALCSDFSETMKSIK